MTKQNFDYDVSRAYPGLFPQILIDITQEMDGIKTKAKRGDFNGIHEHLAIINNIICEVMNENLDLVKLSRIKKNQQ
jgi:lipoate synthase